MDGGGKGEKSILKINFPITQIELNNYIVFIILHRMNFSLSMMDGIKYHWKKNTNVWAVQIIIGNYQH